MGQGFEDSTYRENNKPKINILIKMILQVVISAPRALNSDSFGLQLLHSGIFKKAFSADLLKVNI